jgi:hypothetical protein
MELQAHTPRPAPRAHLTVKMSPGPAPMRRVGSTRLSQQAMTMTLGDWEAASARKCSGWG